jgi:transposase
MFIRRTTIKSRSTGEPYYTYRLVESSRSPKGVRQRTVLNLGRYFELPREQWGSLAQRIEALVQGQLELIPEGLDPQWQSMAEHYAARIVRERGERVAPNPSSSTADYQRVDLGSLDLLRPRSVSVEHAALAAVQRLGLDTKLEALGFNRHQLPAAIGLIVGRMVRPASERATHQWLQHQSGLGELIGHDFATTTLSRLYRVSDQLLSHQAALQAYLYQQEQELFAFEQTITLYDLTNTFFEGTALANPKAKRGRSKEKRSDCPLVTLALVLDGSGFPKRSQVFAGNVSEPKTLEQMLSELAAQPGDQGPTVVLDAGLASEANIAWLREHRYRYLAVSRQRHRQFDPEQATLIHDHDHTRIQVQRVLEPGSSEVLLYCHSSGREHKERGIQRRFSERFEADLQRLAEGLHKKRRVKHYDKVLTRIGRLRQRYSRVARYYDIRLEKDPDTAQATTLEWSRITPQEETFPGVYCLRTNQSEWDEATLWHTYTMLTDLEAVFRSLKSELGMRPVYHHKTDRVDGHLFISVLAYHLVHTLRISLKAQGISLSWEGLRAQLEGQDRVTVVLRRDDGKLYHIRKATRPESRQQLLYEALGISHFPGTTEKTLIDPATGTSQM